MLFSFRAVSQSSGIRSKEPQGVAPSSFTITR